MMTDDYVRVTVMSQASPLSPRPGSQARPRAHPGAHTRGGRGRVRRTRFAGARVGAIAGRAGVNEQLISYYFDSKVGLYRAVQQRWRDTSAGASLPELPLADVVAAFLRLNAEQRSFARLLGMGGSGRHR